MLGALMLTTVVFVLQSSGVVHDVPGIGGPKPVEADSSGTVSINGGAVYTNSASVTLTLAASDTVNGVA